jgi:hypothetical protein
MVAMVEAARRERDIVRSVASLAAAVAHEMNKALSILREQLEMLARDVPASGRRRIDESLATARQIPKWWVGFGTSGGSRSSPRGPTSTGCSTSGSRMSRPMEKRSAGREEAGSTEGRRSSRRNALRTQRLSLIRSPRGPRGRWSGAFSGP